MTKKIIYIIFLSFLFLVFSAVLPQNIQAQAECPEGDNGYCLLSPIFAEEQGKRVEMADYLMRLYNVLFLAAGVTATVILILGGFQYMLSEVGAKKQQAVSMMQNAVYGLLLAIFSYTILYTINPNLLNVNFKLIPIKGLKPVVDPISTSTPDGEDWPSDETVRSALPQGVKVYNESCLKVGQNGCTSIYDLPAVAITKLGQLSQSCFCQILITGGTEYWLHQTHGPGLAIVDIDKDDGTLDRTIRTRGVKSINPQSVSCGIKYADKFTFNGGIYVDEGNHWHVCY